MEVREWQDVRDELITEAETWLDVLGPTCQQVKLSLEIVAANFDDSLCGQTIVEDAAAHALLLHDVSIHEDCLRLWVDEFGMYATLPMPIPVREFIRGWNEGILQ